MTVHAGAENRYGQEGGSMKDEIKLICQLANRARKRFDLDQKSSIKILFRGGIFLFVYR